MSRRTLSLALALSLAAFVGCGDADPNSINNSSDIKGEAPPPGSRPAPSAFANNPTGVDASGLQGTGYPMPKNEPAPGADAPKAEDAAPAAEPGETAEVTLSEDEIAKIRELPEDEAALALRQKVCPISEEPLGSMGKPIAVKVGDKTAFLCCKGCQEEFDKDPQAALAKLGLDK